jgi:hypothetical protein
MAQKIQPIVLLGCREATRAPTAANDTNSRYPQISASSGLRLIPVGVGEFRNLNNAHTMTNVSERAHSDQASQPVGRFIPPIARLFSLATLVTTLLYRITVSQALRGGVVSELRRIPLLKLFGNSEWVPNGAPKAAKRG